MQQTQPETPVQKRQRSPWCYYITGAVWVLYALALPLYRWYHFLIAAAVSAAAFLLADRLLPAKMVQVQQPMPKPDTGDSQVDMLIREGRAAIAKMKEYNGAIPDPEITASIHRLEEITGKILDYIAQKPEEAPKIRKFMNYYLPTTLKLLNYYQLMLKQQVQGENITQSMEHIEQSMHSIVAAFEKQLDNLFQDEALDISTDITVLEGMLAQEGLSGSEFEWKVK